MVPVAVVLILEFLLASAAVIWVVYDQLKHLEEER